jgi:hypothetical protein
MRRRHRRELLQNWCIKVGLCGWSSGISGHFNYFLKKASTFTSWGFHISIKFCNFMVVK